MQWNHNPNGGGNGNNNGSNQSNNNGGGPPPNNNQQPNPNWSPGPPNGPYATPRPHQPAIMGAIDPALSADPSADADASKQIPPLSAALPQNHDPYRSLPAPPQMYPPQYQQHPMQGYAPAQPAPRQRTAIACRYCRRRKIRCSGFDVSEEGKCTNCTRFSQDCIFTPVSAQTQAFVPAHTIYRGQQPPPNVQLYGSYGQPIQQQFPNRDPYQQSPQAPQQQPPQQQQQPPPQQQPGQYAQPPAGYLEPPMYGQPPPPQGTPGSEAGRKRLNDEPHTPTSVPPNPAMQRDGHAHYAYDAPVVGPDHKDPDGVVAAAAAAAAAAARREDGRRVDFKDVGVQVDLPLRKEPDS